MNEIKFFYRFYSFLGLRKWYDNKLTRRALHLNGFYIYRSKKKAIRMAKKFTREVKVVYWVIKESAGYYVLNRDHIDELNKRESKKKGGKRFKSKELDKMCVWRSPAYKSL